MHDQIENNNNLITVNTSTANASVNTSTVQVSDGPFGMTLEMWKAVKWATVIAIVLMLMQQFSGINAVFYYSSTILNNAGMIDVKDDILLLLLRLLLLLHSVFSI